MEKLVLLTGSDTGDRLYFLNKAKELIQQRIGTILKTSGILETEPWGFEADTKFLNQAMLAATELSPDQVLTEIQKIENELGRVRGSEQWVSRTIDIDILCWEDQVMDTEKLKIPHVQLHNRSFALIPLCEIVPDWIHPRMGRSYAHLLNDQQPITTTTNTP